LCGDTAVGGCVEDVGGCSLFVGVAGALLAVESAGALEDRLRSRFVRHSAAIFESTVGSFSRLGDVAP
jgi:hypothetical protein